MILYDESVKEDMFFWIRGWFIMDFSCKQLVFNSYNGQSHGSLTLLEGWNKVIHYPLPNLFYLFKFYIGLSTIYLMMIYFGGMRCQTGVPI